MTQTTIRSVALVCALFLAGGCGAAFSALAALGQGVSAVGSATDFAEHMAAQYFARHPSEIRQGQVTKAIGSTRAATAALDAARLVAEAIDDDRLGDARTEAKRAYRELVELLVSLGITSGQGIGGAETEAPLAIPFEPISPDVIDSHL